MLTQRNSAVKKLINSKLTLSYQSGRIGKRMERMERMKTDFNPAYGVMWMSRRRGKVRFNPFSPFHPFYNPVVFSKKEAKLQK